MAVATGNPIVVPLWADGAPGFETRRNEPEKAKDWWVKNVHNPSLSVYLPPKKKRNGTAVLIAPGGGFHELVFDAEGRDPGIFLSKLGIVAVALKYRLPFEEDSPYKFPTHPQQDIKRAMRVLRHHAAEWDVDPGRVGVLGFSAGGVVAAMVAYANGQGSADAADPIDRLSCKPDFQMLVYPGPGFIPANLDQEAPPTFLVVANDDDLAPVCVELLTKYRAAKRPIEAHFFAKGDHAFNMGYRSSLASIKGWPQRMADWLNDNGYLRH